MIHHELNSYKTNQNNHHVLENQLDLKGRITGKPDIWCSKPMVFPQIALVSVLFFFGWTNPVTTWRFPRGTPVVTMRFNTKPCSYDLDDDWVYPQPETITFPWTSRRRTPRTVPQFVSEVGGNNSSKLWVYGRYIEQDGAPSRASDRVQLVYVCGWMNYGLW